MGPDPFRYAPPMAPDAALAPDSRAQLVLAVKMAVGFVVGAIMVGIVGPIVLAIVVGLATGH